MELEELKTNYPLDVPAICVKKSRVAELEEGLATLYELQVEFGFVTKASRAN